MYSGMCVCEPFSRSLPSHHDPNPLPLRSAFSSSPYRAYRDISWHRHQTTNVVCHPLAFSISPPFRAVQLATPLHRIFRFCLDFCRFDFCVNCLRLIAVLNLLKDILDKRREAKWQSKRVRSFLFGISKFIWSLLLGFFFKQYNLLLRTVACS